MWVQNVSGMTWEASLDLKNAPEMQDCVRFIRLPDQLIQWRIKRHFIPFLLWNWLTSHPSARGRHRDLTQARPLTAERARAHARRGSGKRKLGRGHSCGQGDTQEKVHLFFNTSAGMMSEGSRVVLHIIIGAHEFRMLTRALKIRPLFSNPSIIKIVKTKGLGDPKFGDNGAWMRWRRWTEKKTKNWLLGYGTNIFPQEPHLSRRLIRTPPGHLSDHVQLEGDAKADAGIHRISIKHT